MNGWSLAAGVLLIAAAAVDAVWTALWADAGAGPITSRLASRVWAAWRWSVGAGRDRALSLAGPVILLAAPLVWMLLLWAGWTLVFAADPGSIRGTGGPVDVDGWDRAWFAGYTLFTLGNGDFAPVGGGWQMVTAVASASGLITAGVGVSYIVSVVGAVVQQRAFATVVTGIGKSAEEVVTVAWRDGGFGALEGQLDGIGERLGLLTQQHLAYPILHFYHAQRPREASVLAVAILDDALTLLAHGVAERARPDPAVLRSARESVGGYVATLASVVEPAAESPPPPDLNRLRDADVPTVDDATFAAALENLCERRRRLLAMVQNGGWPWPPLRSDDYTRI